MNNRKLFSAIAALVVAVGLIAVGARIFSVTRQAALVDQCQFDAEGLAIARVPIMRAGSYTVLARYIGGDDTLTRTVRFASHLNGCEELDRAELSATWAAIAQVSYDRPTEVLVQLAEREVPTYGHVSILLLPVDSALRCHDKPTCTYTKGDERFTVTPARNFSDDFTVSASAAYDPQRDRLRYIDVYSTNTSIRLGEAGQFDDRLGDTTQVGVYRSGQILAYQTNASGDLEVASSRLQWYIAGLVVGLIAVGALIWLAVQVADGHIANRKFLHRRELYLDDAKWLSERSWRVRYYAVVVSGVVAVVLIVIALLQANVISVTRIQGSSMEPNASDGQWRLVNRWPVTVQQIVGSSAAVQRGKAAFIDRKYLMAAGSKNQDLLYKRIIAVGGDTVYLGADGVTVLDSSGQRVSSSTDDEVAIGMTYAPLAVEVPVGHIFVLGDNRSSSIDSRVFGSIPASAIVGLDIE